MNQQKNKTKKSYTVYIVLIIIMMIFFCLIFIIDFPSGDPLSQFEEVHYPNCSDYDSREDCLIDFAYKEKNPNYCLLMFDDQIIKLSSASLKFVECQMGAAYVTNKNSLCNVIDYWRDRQACTSAVRQNISNCKETEVFIPICMGFIAGQQNNISICNELPLFTREKCLIRAAKVMNDKNICNDIVNESLKGTEKTWNDIFYTRCTNFFEINPVIN